MSAASKRRSWVLLALGLTLVGVALLGLAGVLRHAQLEILAQFFDADPATGALIEHAPSDQRSSVMAGGYYRLADWKASALHGLCLGLVLAAWGLRRRARDTGLPLTRMSAPLWLPVLALAGAMFVLHPYFDWVLQELLELLIPARVIEVGTCMRELSGCSRLFGHELVRWALLAVVAGSALLMIPAGRAAWRAGERGHRLSHRASAAAIACFLLGSVAFVATRGERLDARASLAGCERSGAATPRAKSLRWDLNSSSVELIAPRVQVSPVQAWSAYSWVVNGPYWADAGRYQVFADGAVTLTPGDGELLGVDGALEHAVMTDAEFELRLRERAARDREFIDPDWFERQVRVVELYVDEGAELERMIELLEIARATGVGAVIVLGEVRLDSGLPSLADQYWRVYVPVAHFDLRRPSDWRASDFPSWAALVNYAARQGAAGLPLGTVPGLHPGL